MPRKKKVESAPYAYPLAIRGGNYGYNSLHIWERKGGGEQHQLQWYERERSVIRVDVIDFGDTELRLMFTVMEAYAVEKFGVVDVRP
ncbi:hypothetical protein ACWD25_52475 [Streptomyces sp. NPDC002920]